MALSILFRPLLLGACCCRLGAAHLRAASSGRLAAGEGERGALQSRDGGTPKLCSLPGQPGFETGIEIYANQSDNTRMLQFAGFGTGHFDGFAVETMVKCRGEMPASCTAGSNQSCADCPCQQDDTLFGNYENHMAKYLVPMCTNPPDKSRTEPFRVLLIGLGGGALNQFIMDKCPQGTRVESVEYDPRMIEAATRFFGLHIQEGVNEVVQGDGGAIVQERANQGQKYDLVLVDAFAGPFQVPESCRSETFIRNVQQLLRKNGMALQNIEMGQYEKTLPVWQKVFGDDAVDSESLKGGGEMAIGHLIVAEAPWGV